MSNTEQRLYYTDSYLREFHARILETDGCRIVLDRTAFYPTSGGQPNDVGTINGIPVLDVIDEDDRIVHVLQEPLVRNEANCAVDWARRWDHMQQHTGQHLLSAVLAERFGFQTVSFHMGTATSTIDLATNSLSANQIEAAELRVNEVVQENRSVTIAFEDASEAEGLRKASERAGALRIITIEGIDRSACGGTHVRSTGEIGPIFLRGVDKIRGNVRLEFVCGGRAVRRARADYNSLDRAARAFSARSEEVPELVAANLEKLKEADKTRRKLEAELAGHRGRSLYDQTNPNSEGLRLAEQVFAAGPLREDVRNEANSFVAGPRAVFVALTESPGSVLLAASADAGVHCGNILKRVLPEFGGRGGGAANLAQGSFSGDLASFRKRLLEVLLADAV